jgi:ABC-type multidrug transport system fused ATPase/permease subunit
MSTTTVEAPVHAPQEELPIPKELEGAWAVLKRGLRESPELRSGLAFTVVVSIAATIAALLAPILIQQIFDHGFTPNGFRAGFVFSICGAAFVLVILTYVAGRAAARRLATSSEAALKALRVKGFEHIHRLSIAAQTQERRGVYVTQSIALALRLPSVTNVSRK